MKTKVLSIAVLLASVFTASSMAQTPDTKQQCQTPKECTATKCKPTECTKSECSPFAGLNLTDKQKAELQALKPSKEQLKAKKDEAKAKKDAYRKQMRDEKIQMRKDYLAKVKNILTPEQYVQFLENSYVNQAFNKAGKNDKRGGKDFKGDRRHDNHRDMKGQRPDQKK